MFGQDGAHGLEGLLEQGSSTTEIQACVSGFAKNAAVGEKEVRIPLEKMSGLRDSSWSEIEPRKVGCLQVGGRDSPEFISAEGGQEIAIALKVGEQFQAPGFAVIVGGFGRIVGEAVDLRQGVTPGMVESSAAGIVRNDRVGVAKPRDVVGLARRQEGDGALSEGAGRRSAEKKGVACSSKMRSQ